MEKHHSMLKLKKKKKKSKKVNIYFNLGKLHFTILNYAVGYTLHHKLFECILCSLHPKLSHL